MISMKKNILLLLLLISFSNYSQTISINNFNSEAIIQKSTPQVSSISTGEPFSYSIDFQSLNNSKTLTITDVLPSGLCYSPTDIIADNSFIDFNDNIVSNPNSIPSLIDTSNLPTVVFNIPNNIKRGSFTITVRFCGGITENGFTVTNNICATYGIGDINDENFCSTTGLTSVASATNPWGNITKEPLFPAILGNDGNYYIPTSGGIVNYKIKIEKNNPYKSSIFGMLNLDDVSITELFSPCATISLVSGPGTLNTTTNSIELTNNLQGNVANESAEFIISVDYSNCTLTNGQIVSNTVELNGTPIGGTPSTNISNDTADVIAVDTLPQPNLNSSFTKTVEVFNPVPGCMGKYIIQVINNDNRPISFLDISDQLPNEILPHSINISGLINSASVTDTFNLSINGGSPILFPMSFGYSSSPSNWTNTSVNSFSLNADNNTLLYPGDSVQIIISFTINTTLPLGTTISNCAHFEASIIDSPNNINVSINEDSCVPFTITAPEIKLCAEKIVRKANTNDPFVTDLTNVIPTDELEFQICIQNNGSLDFNGSLVDNLDSRYEFLSIVSDNFPPGTTFNQNGQTLTWSNIDLLQSCNTFSGDYGCINVANQSYCAIIKVKVKPYTAPGNIDNIATLSDGNNNSFITEAAKVNVIEAAVLSFNKEVSKDYVNYYQSLSYNPTCDSSIYYKLTVTNLGNKDLLQYQIIDELPAVNDIYFPTTINRNSDFSLSNIINNSATDFSVSYLDTTPSTLNSSTNFNCNSVSSGFPTSSNSTKSILFESINPLLIAGSTEIVLEGIMPPANNLVDGEMIVNSAYLINCDLNSNIIIPSNMVEVEIDNPICSILNFDSYTTAVPTLFPLAIQQLLSSNSILNNTIDKEYGDVDNDGDIDILFTKMDTNSGFPVLHWLENTAGMGNIPTFNTTPINLNIQNAISFRLYDWNTDGCDDLIVLGWNAQVVLFISNCNGTFSYGDVLLNDLSEYGYSPYLFLEIGDLNNDSLPDIIISSGNNFGTYYFEHTGATSNPYYILPTPQTYSSTLSYSNPFIYENNGSFPIPELYDADCDGDLDLFISDPFVGPPNYQGGRMYFHENNGNLTSATLPDINIVGTYNQFGFLDTPVGVNDLSCDWIVTRIVDFFGNGCPIAILFKPCNETYYFYVQEDCLCSDSPLLSLEDTSNINDHSLYKVFPNPSSTGIQISGIFSDECRYQIYNIQGKKVSEGKYTNDKIIDISNYLDGIYLIRLLEGEKNRTFKFIKK